MATQVPDTANNTASRRGRGASSDELAVIAQRAQAFTNASGVAIALSEGNADEIICRARSGASAPDVGAALRVEGTFTGLCIQSGKELRCDDCETDTRVDTAAIRALNIRSMVVTPIREENRVIGVLAVFAPTPHAFTITHVAVLKTMADQISALLQRDRRAREEGHAVEAVRPPAPAAAARPAVVAPAPAVPPAVVIKPVPAAAARTTAPVVSKVEPVKSAPPMEVVPLAMPPKKEEKHVDTSHRASFGTFDSVAAEVKKPGSRFIVMGVVAVLVIAAAATFAFLKMQKSGAAQAQQHPQEAANVTAPPPTTAPASTQPAAPGGGAASPAPSNVGVTSGANNVVSAKSASEAESAKKSAAKNQPEKPAPAEKPAPVVATLTNAGQSRIAQNSAPAVPDAAPTFTVPSGSMPAPLTTLAQPIASSTPSAASLSQSQLEPLQLIRTAPLTYPPIAKARHITGQVRVEVAVGKDGKVANVRLISGAAIFKDAAFEAVQRYQFKPAKLNGQPIEQTTQILLNFHE
jgi:TonB family protein